MIRNLTETRDADAVTDLFHRAADYTMLESGQAPGPAQTTDFFASAPPGGDPATSLRLGYFLPAGLLVAIAEVGFGYPNPGDAYIGLLLIDPAYRGKRLGQQMVGHICSAASARRAPRVLIAVLEANPKGHRFWSKMGFVEEMRSQPKQIGLKTHVQIRMARPL